MSRIQVPGGMKRRVLRWYDYSWSRGRIQGGGDINTALGLLPDKLKTELALHVNLSVLKKVCCLNKMSVLFTFCYDRVNRTLNTVCDCVVKNVECIKTYTITKE